MKSINWIVSGLVSLGMIVLAVSMFWSMPVEVFINLVSRMRKHQIAYFRGGRKLSDMLEAKGLEKQVDQALKDGISIPVEAVLDNRPDDAEQGEQIGLFGE